MDLIEYLFSNMQMNALVVFGVFLLLGVMGGMVANRLKWMPTITAFMLLGLMMGPEGAGLISKTMLVKSSVLVDIALGLILFKLGNMLHPKAMMRSRKLMVSAAFESAATFICVFILMLALGFKGLVAAIVAAICVSSSPAVLVHVAEELEARGVVTSRAKSLVALNNFFSFLLFSMAVPMAMAAGDEGLGLVMAIGLPAYQLFMAMVIGALVAWAATAIAHFLTDKGDHYRFAIAIGAIMLTLGLCDMLHASKILAPLILGNAVCWFEKTPHKLSKVGLGEGGDLFFIVLFVMAGAKISLSALWGAGLVALALVAVRSIAKFIGIFAAGRVVNVEPRQSVAISLLLVPMAGMAIGLVGTTLQLAPHVGEQVATLVFATVAIFETIGPFFAAYALKLVGEAGRRTEDVEGDELA